MDNRTKALALARDPALTEKDASTLTELYFELGDDAIIIAAAAAGNTKALKAILSRRTNDNAIARAAVKEACRRSSSIKVVLMIAAERTYLIDAGVLVAITCAIRAGTADAKEVAESIKYAPAYLRVCDASVFAVDMRAAFCNIWPNAWIGITISNQSDDLDVFARICERPLAWCTETISLCAFLKSLSDEVVAALTIRAAKRGGVAALSVLAPLLMLSPPDTASADSSYPMQDAMSIVLSRPVYGFGEPPAGCAPFGSSENKAAAVLALAAWCAPSPPALEAIAEGATQSIDNVKIALRRWRGTPALREARDSLRDGPAREWEVLSHKMWGLFAAVPATFDE